jgi:hypothetical protein
VYRKTSDEASLLDGFTMTRLPLWKRTSTRVQRRMKRSVRFGELEPWTGVRRRGVSKVKKHLMQRVFHARARRRHRDKGRAESPRFGVKSPRARRGAGLLVTLRPSSRRGCRLGRGRRIAWRWHFRDQTRVGGWSSGPACCSGGANRVHDDREVPFSR